jgi:plasmid stability protein
VPTLVVENVPPAMYERLRQRAEEQHRSLPEETLRVLEEALWGRGTPSPRLPELVPNEDVPAPYDLPRSSTPVPVPARAGQPRRLDSFT